MRITRCAHLCAPPRIIVVSSLHTRRIRHLPDRVDALQLGGINAVRTIILARSRESAALDRAQNRGPVQACELRRCAERQHHAQPLWTAPMRTEAGLRGA